MDRTCPAVILIILMRFFIQLRTNAPAEGALTTLRYVTAAVALIASYRP